MNTDELEFALYEAERKVLKIQTKLHCWATETQHGLWSARCPETGTPGAGSGLGKRAGRQGRNRAPGRLHHTGSVRPTLKSACY